MKSKTQLCIETHIFNKPKWQTFHSTIAGALFVLLGLGY